VGGKKRKEKKRKEKKKGTSYLRGGRSGKS
jgi:hypothetical protein